MPEPNKAAQVMTFTFPVPVEQVAPNRVEMRVRPFDKPVYSEAMMDYACDMLGDREGERLLEDFTERLTREIIIRSLL